MEKLRKISAPSSKRLLQSKAYGRPKRRSKYLQLRENPRYRSVITPVSECILCQKSIEISQLPCIIKKALYRRYCSSLNYYYSRDINKIITGTTSPALACFREVFVFDSQHEWLKRFYNWIDSKSKIKKLMDLEQGLKKLYRPRIHFLAIEKTLDKYYRHKHRVIEKEQKKMMEMEAQKQEKNEMGQKHLGMLGKSGSTMNLRLQLDRLKKADDKSHVIEPLNQRDLENRLLNELDHDTTYQNILKKEKQKDTGVNLRLVNANLKMAIGNQLNEEGPSLSRIQNENGRKNSVSIISQQLKEKVSEIYSMDFSRKPSCQILFDPDAEISRSFLDFYPCLIGLGGLGEEITTKKNKDSVAAGLNQIKASKNNATTTTSISNSSNQGGLGVPEKQYDQKTIELQRAANTTAGVLQNALTKKKNDSTSTTNESRKQKRGVRNKSTEDSRAIAQRDLKMSPEKGQKSSHSKQKSAECRCIGKKISSNTQKEFSGQKKIKENNARIPVDALFSHLIEEDKWTKTSYEKKKERKKSGDAFQCFKPKEKAQKRSNSSNTNPPISKGTSGTPVKCMRNTGNPSISDSGKKSFENFARVSTVPQHSLTKNSSLGNLASSLRYSCGNNHVNNLGNIKVHHLTQTFNMKEIKQEGMAWQRDNPGCKTEADESKSNPGVNSERKNPFVKTVKQNQNSKHLSSGISGESSSVYSIKDAKNRLGILKTEPDNSHLDSKQLGSGNISDHIKHPSATSKASNKKNFDILKLVPRLKKEDLQGSSLVHQNSPAHIKSKHDSAMKNKKKEMAQNQGHFLGVKEASDSNSKMRKTKKRQTPNCQTEPAFTAQFYHNATSNISQQSLVASSNAMMRRTESTAILPNPSYQEVLNQRNFSLKKTGQAQDELLSSLKFCHSPKSLFLKPENEPKQFQTEDLRKEFESIPIKSSILAQAAFPSFALDRGLVSAKSTSNSNSKKNAKKDSEFSHSIQVTKERIRKELKEADNKKNIAAGGRTNPTRHLTSAIASQIASNKMQSGKAGCAFESSCIKKKPILSLNPRGLAVGSSSGIRNSFSPHGASHGFRK